MFLSREELVELFREAPKESFELLLRNIRIREYLRALHAKHVSGLELFYDENFNKIFEEFFRFFFRPLETVVHGARQLRFLFFAFDLGLMEAQSETLRTYSDFLRSWFDHLRLMSGIVMSGILPRSATDVVRDFIGTYRERLESQRIDLTEYPVEYPFLLPKTAFQNLEKSVDHWERFSQAFKEYRRMIKGTYVEAADKFIAETHGKKFDRYEEFAGAFFGFEAQAFDELLKSPKYLEVQKSMLENMMDYVYFSRKFFEDTLESNPMNPFATISMMDEAFKRISDLKRKLSELEKRLSRLEARR